MSSKTAMRFRKADREEERLPGPVVEEVDRQRSYHFRKALGTVLSDTHMIVPDDLVVFGDVLPTPIKAGKYPALRSVWIMW